MFENFLFKKQLFLNNNNNKTKTKEIHFPKLDRNDVFPMEGSSLKE